MKAKKNINKRTGGGFDLIIQNLKITNININSIYEIIDSNVSSFHPDHPFFNLFGNESITRYKFIEKFKILLIAFDLLCDSEKVELDSDEFVTINSSRFIIQKFTYSLMNQFQIKIRDMHSILWFSTLGKTLLDTLAFADGNSISERIKNSFGQNAKIIWQKWSNLVKKPHKNPYIENTKYNINLFFDDVFMYLECVPIETLKIIKKINTDTNIEKYLDKLLDYLNIIDHQGIAHTPDVFNISFSNYNVAKDDVFNFVMFNEFNNWFLYAESVGYPNPIFLRAYIPIVQTFTSKEKKSLSNYSHRDLYENMRMIKYHKSGQWIQKNIELDTDEVIREVIKKIQDHFEVN